MPATLRILSVALIPQYCETNTVVAEQKPTKIIVISQPHCPIIPTDESATVPKLLTSNVSASVNELVSKFCKATGNARRNVSCQNFLFANKFFVNFVLTPQFYHANMQHVQIQAFLPLLSFL